MIDGVIPVRFSSLTNRVFLLPSRILYCYIEMAYFRDECVVKPVYPDWGRQ